MKNSKKETPRSENENEPKTRRRRCFRPSGRRCRRHLHAFKKRELFTQESKPPRSESNMRTEKTQNPQRNPKCNHKSKNLSLQEEHAIRSTRHDHHRDLL
ncbi:hypothetical protein VIGAN_11081700 [Vigna angularis var. angularis]|uniref:Uncharacterized protein n=1 Tax=Vigna angularis var. angularis TaxID=157739 RepID=A0A0S3T965_PHAAN|nr:hypothetical protein VIGAN_11081700 [Vigna angularis var. angularis]